MSEGYNGWTNWETWVVNLWIDNDGYAGGSLGVSEQADELVSTALADDSDDPLGDATGELADWLAERIEDDLAVESLKGLMSDIVGGTLSSVNWYEIAKHYVQDALDSASKEEAK